ncbi:Outer membrane receptor proteins, mostly Fe transport [Flexibacter flexilis DSM 6793]|uniref:Outer membrane receptor proteins, mostly Fe transport n=1 Tax=Flexibacter flexilis DSM 6793 TaxID=927664 RepID=A0A1I1G7J0_9BACT|nr:TonB-dependent receptor [Flexibacter flexilis]SFC07286.1 Outer membrane receptor proteins, mostly Fe transport [Flexibacter flexilis DSM 6793]
MKTLKYWLLVLCAWASVGAYAQQTQTAKGVVLSASSNGTFEPLVDATVHWQGTTVGAVTDSNGIFSVRIVPETNNLIISYLGYKSDTLNIKNPQQLRVVLQENGVLAEVNIEHERASSYISALEPVRTQIMTEKELFKAACCNLSESFETNPSVDVAFSDAVSGAKQIQMLGLAGIYTQLTNENMPATRGLAAAQGLNYTAGTWIESIQVTKGIGSVANGFESVAGQINVELRKPEKIDKLLFNAYANEMGRTEANLNLSKKVNNRWATALLLHGNYLDNSIKRTLDMNHDSFRDIPAGKQFNALNRWKYDNGKGLMAQMGVRAVWDLREGGQLEDGHHTAAYKIRIQTQRQEVWGKLGYVFPQKKYKSIGLMASLTNHEQDNIFGLKQYDARQKSLYANLIYQSIIGTTFHKWRAGASLQADDYRETLNDLAFSRREQSTGAFGEYTFSGVKNLVLVAGLRADYNNLYGAFVTPRLHAKYDWDENTTLRLSYGRGQRTANIIAENMPLLASSRALEVQTTDLQRKAYGLTPEIAWNGGLSLTREFRLWYRNGSVTVDYFRTDFQNQVVVDLDASPQKVLFYNLKGKSFSNSVQAELNYSPVKRLDVKAVYRWLDVRTRYRQTDWLQKPLVAQHRAFVNVGYATRSQWKFDVTAQWWGKKRLPSTASNPEAYQMGTYSPDYVQLNAQITKSFSKKLDVYVGGENLTSYRQKRLILSAEDPYTPYFDASMVWGNVLGRMLYAGLRYRI